MRASAHACKWPGILYKPAYETFADSGAARCGLTWVGYLGLAPNVLLLVRPEIVVVFDTYDFEPHLGLHRSFEPLPVTGSRHSHCARWVVLKEKLELVRFSSRRRLLAVTSSFRLDLIEQILLDTRHGYCCWLLLPTSGLRHLAPTRKRPGSVPRRTNVTRGPRTTLIFSNVEFKSCLPQKWLV